MRELRPTPIRELLRRLVREVAQGRCFDLPERAYWSPAPGADLSCRFHGIPAATPVGPAAGPHSQMAQNILLSYMAGGRIMELKTVQIMDRLQIPRPCIDTRNVGFNIEWSQELRIEESLHEYVAAAWLINIARGENWIKAPARLTPEQDPVIYDISVGYDLNGIRSRRVIDYLRQMMDASAAIARLEKEVAAEFPQFLKYRPDPKLSATATLSTFHGCPPEEIEGIVAHLLEEVGLHTVVKMNPTMLGREGVEGLLRDTLGYTHLHTNPKAYEVGLPFDASLDMIRRLKAKADAAGRGLSVKFSNTLEVLNEEGHLPKSEAVQYLSGTPLHVITTVLMDKWRTALGWDVPMSYSAGIDKSNIGEILRAGCVPVTICTDLLKPGGYQRLCEMLRAYEGEMQARGAASLSEDVGSIGQRHAHLTAYAAGLPADSRYHNDRNNRLPKKIKSHLELFDCINCDKCIPVCPNDAMFSYETGGGSFPLQTVRFVPGSGFTVEQDGALDIKKEHQLANFADWCNECGNCDTHCPENGGPFIEKPRLFGTRQAWLEAAPADGFYFEDAASPTIIGRLDGRDYEFEIHPESRRGFLRDTFLLVEFDLDTHAVVETHLSQVLTAERALSTRTYLVMRALLEGVYLAEAANALNAGRA